VIGVKRDRAAWTAMVDSMVARGARATEAEKKQILDYLITQVGK
jgi:hypothetical protein